MAELLVVYWEWSEGTPHAGARFWAAHSADGGDGRLRDWPTDGTLRALGAAKVTVVEGEGLELLDGIARRRSCRVCGCTNLKACPGRCWWVEPDLCSSCVGKEAADV